MTASPARSPFEAERDRLTWLSYRMLGSWRDAEDVVQDVAVEWIIAADAIENPAGWLTTITVRRSIDALRRRRRAETYVGPWLPEPFVSEPVSGPSGSAPEESVERDETLTMVFLTLAERLTPPQRAVIVLRALDYSHDEVARMLQITSAASRQHQRRGTVALRRAEEAVANRQSGRCAHRGPSHRSQEERALLTAFLTAARDGDVEALSALLADEVVAYNDGGGRMRAALRPLFGRANVARFVVGVADLHRARRAVRLVTVNGGPGAIVTLSGAEHVVSLDVRDGVIHRVFDVCNPDKLGRVRETGRPQPVV
ncbi:RNA polymerase sigma-70 factor (ECF subfamily) [Actinoalloteichus hoggarensis]|uniref:ECF RNA polymerase sigma factor SigJ n=1 Tax=Actinoalloteichus hoggarensis TaxID=1470176 RepID=A0A221VXU6_9PSEU|nr:sigma-70 family RNA polymerase sigma factor [Actinoalloteichus hoggarensis]ASO18297.1 ECF RNA polymerase sigma factor SigJ [Actinoalloteichus hoggarensis]MBB5921659.1 RNA polymerase sigma-70 factor (ECF subfamily) [Actinoalloteichus hoggarensis]